MTPEEQEIAKLGRSWASPDSLRRVSIICPVKNRGARPLEYGACGTFITSTDSLLPEGIHLTMLRTSTDNDNPALFFYIPLVRPDNPNHYVGYAQCVVPVASLLGGINLLLKNRDKPGQTVVHTWEPKA